MGLYDSFYDEDSKCPKCNAKITTDWQTKHLESCWSHGERVISSAGSLREEFANRLSHLQESCKHEKTKWRPIEWAPGHISGQGRVCLKCEKTLETRNEFEPDNPKLRSLLKRTKRLR
jgi:hypothetical protein